jgi:hypothetical protein
LPISTWDEPNDDADDEEQYENELTSTIVINVNILIRVDGDEPVPYNIENAISEIKFDFILKIYFFCILYKKKRNISQFLSIKNFNKKSVKLYFSSGKNDV